jgi:hypothetical protein
MTSRHSDYIRLCISVAGHRWDLLVPKRSSPWDAPVYLYPENSGAVKYSCLKRFIELRPDLWAVIQECYHPTKYQIEGRSCQVTCKYLIG